MPAAEDRLALASASQVALETDVEVKAAPARGASLFSGVANLANSILGTGLLALPGAFRDAGMVFGLVFATLSALLGILSLHLLSQSSAVVGRPSTIYSVCEAALPRFSILVDGAIVVGSTLGAAGYQIVAGDSLTHVFAGTPRWAWTLASAALVAPLSVLRRIDMLRFTSTLALLCLLYIALVVVLFFVPTAGVPELTPVCNASTAACPPVARAFGEPVATVRALATFTSAYTCQQNLPTVANELERPTPARMLIVTSSAIGLAWALYVVVAIAGYLTFGDAVRGDILLNYPESWITDVARVGIAFVVLSSYPLLAFATRMSSRSLWATFSAAWLGGKAPGAAESPRGSGGAAESDGVVVREDGVFDLDRTTLCIVGTFLALTTLIALVVDSLGKIVNIAGALVGNVITFIAPGACYWLLHRREAAPRTLTRLAFGVLVLGVVLVPVSTVLSLTPH